MIFLSSLISHIYIHLSGNKRKGGKGVRNPRVPVTNTGKYIYYIQKKGGFGVRRDDIEYMKVSYRPNMLGYSKPCVCGSQTHRTTNDPACFLNDQYIDVVEDYLQNYYN